MQNHRRRVVAIDRISDQHLDVTEDEGNFAAGNQHAVTVRSDRDHTQAQEAILLFVQHWLGLGKQIIEQYSATYSGGEWS